MKKALSAVALIAAVILGGPAAGAAPVDENNDGIVCMKLTGSGRILEKDNRVGTASECPNGYFAVDTRQERKVFCDTVKECGALRELCIAAGWIYEDHYDENDEWLYGDCRQRPPTPG